MQRQIPDPSRSQDNSRAVAVLSRTWPRLRVPDRDVNCPSAREFLERIASREPLGQTPRD